MGSRGILRGPNKFIKHLFFPHNSQQQTKRCYRTPLHHPIHCGLTGCPIKTQKCLKKCGMVPKSAEWWQGIWNINFFCQSLKITSDILRCIRYSALQCHLAAAFYFKINVASFIFSDLSSDARTSSCLYFKRYIIYGQNSHSQEFQQNNLLKSCIGSLVKPENCNRTASPSDLAHCGGGPRV